MMALRHLPLTDYAAPTGTPIIAAADALVGTNYLYRFVGAINIVSQRGNLQCFISIMF